MAHVCAGGRFPKWGVMGGWEQDMSTLPAGGLTYSSSPRSEILDSIWRVNASFLKSTSQLGRKRGDKMNTGRVGGLVGHPKG